METVVVGFGGSIIAPEELDPGHLQEVARHVAAWSQDRRLFVVVGGGRTARRYIEAARGLGVPEEDLDRIGIAATRLNAELLACLLRSGGASVGPVPHDVETALGRPGLVVMGGTDPGHSTDRVAAELAVGTGAARLVNVTNVDGVYSKDPSQHADAEHRERLGFPELLAIVGDTTWRRAGAAGVLDGPATALVARHGMTTCVVNGRDLGNVGRAVVGEAFHGTLVEGPPVEATA